MNLGLHIFNYLQKNGSVELPGFGVFSIQKKSAHLDESSSVLLPPIQEINFKNNYLVFNSDLSKYIADITGENLFVIQTQIKEEVLLWKEELQKNKNLIIDELGEFTLENDEIILSATNDFTNNPSYFGLEKIDLKEIEKSKVNEEEILETDNQYVFNKSVLWTFLLIIPVGGMIYMALNYKDKIFGKKSFDRSAKISTPEIKKDQTKIDSLSKDSIKINSTDSLKTKK